MINASKNKPSNRYQERNGGKLPDMKTILRYNRKKNKILEPSLVKKVSDVTIDDNLRTLLVEQFVILSDSSCLVAGYRLPTINEIVQF